MSEMIFSVTNKNVADVIPRISQMINKGLFAGEVVCTLSRPLRTPKQNDKLHPLIRDVQTQVEWMGLITEEEWRYFFSGIIQGQKPVPTPEGGIIMIGGSLECQVALNGGRILENIADKACSNSNFECRNRDIVASDENSYGN